jgi:PAS domain-containing protein
MVGKMMAIELSATILGLVLLAGAILLLVATLVGTRRDAAPNDSTAQRSTGPVFLFDGQELIDCNSAARVILGQSNSGGNDWQKLLAFLSPYFTALDDRLGSLAKLGAIAETGAAENGKIILLEAEMNAGLTRICLIDPDVTDGPGVALALSHRALETEVQELRKAAAAAPMLIWREHSEGEIVWANDSYVMLAASTLPAGRDLSWPLPRLFERSAVLQSASRQRQSVAIVQAAGATPKVHWFDLTTTADKGALLCFAAPVDAAVAAETSLREFMQTLSKTFAQLPIGLAIFDKDRKLQMFNPALLELTTLPPDFLSLKPSMMSVLDAMRDRNLLPEPKDYATWRRQITEIERAAAAGAYLENWALPDGQTFRVTGRPHPNGGLALMIEDISSEMQRSRRYRADLEVSQSVLDQISDAIAVFSPAGHVIWCNHAYTEMWGHDPSATLGDMTIRTVTDHWKTRAAPTALWVEIDEYIHTVGIRRAWSKEVRLQDGRLLMCNIAPVAAGSTMVAFRSAGQDGAAAKSPQKLPTTALRTAS